MKLSRKLLTLQAVAELPLEVLRNLPLSDFRGCLIGSEIERTIFPGGIAIPKFIARKGDTARMIYARAIREISAIQSKLDATSSEVGANTWSEWAAHAQSEGLRRMTESAANMRATQLTTIIAYLLRTEWNGTTCLHIGCGRAIEESRRGYSPLCLASQQAYENTARVERHTHGCKHGKVVRIKSSRSLQLGYGPVTTQMLMTLAA